MNYKSSLISNERSVGSELITETNKIFDKKDWGMKKAIGELSLKTENPADDRNTTLFPDLIIFKDEDNLQPLMGWELKMPDVSINDSEFISNAKDKADRLSTGVFVLWNYQYVSIFIRNEKGEWEDEPTKFFDEYSTILIDRKSVNKNKKIWKKQLEEVLIYLNEQLIANKFSVAPIDFNISSYVDTISEKLAPLSAHYYSEQKDIFFKRYILNWVNTEKAELSSISEIVDNEKAYLAFAKSIIIKWINRIIFSHLIRKDYNGINDLLVKFSENTDIEAMAKSYNIEVNNTDFYTVLSVGEYETILPKEVIDSLNEFNLFLSNSDFSKASKSFVSEILENIVDVSKRELMGLYTTPDNLAKLLVYLTIDKAEGEYADLTVGSGTIAKNITDYITEFNSLEYAHNHVWSADKYNYPLQIANLTLTSADSINLKNIVFQSDVFDLYNEREVEIINPKNGEKEILKIPKFNYLISNLPFISSNNREKSEKIERFLSKVPIDRKADLYQLILLKYYDLLDKTNGKIGVITSNSWFKTLREYKSFYKVLLEYYDVEYILYSNEGRWFSNADIVSSIIILRSKNFDFKNKTNFISLNINPITCDENQIKDLSNSILFNNDSNLFNSKEYSYDEVEQIINLGLSLEVLFEDVNWIFKIKSKLKPLNQVFNSSRGVRTGADKIFITDEKYADDEDSYPILKNMSNINNYIIEKTNHYYFYTRDSLKDIENKKKIKTLNYIKKIGSFPESLKRKKDSNDKWYQADQKPQFADFSTSINPENRFFWVLFKEPTVVNQRVTAFKLKDGFKKDKELIHALLNTSLSIFMLMGSGFGRALGVTDLTNDGISQSHFLNPSLLSKESKNKILEKWRCVRDKPIVNIQDQLNDDKWIEFNKLVYEEYELPENIYDTIKSNIITLISRRTGSKNL